MALNMRFFLTMLLYFWGHMVAAWKQNLYFRKSNQSGLVYVYLQGNHGNHRCINTWNIKLHNQIIKLSLLVAWYLYAYVCACYNQHYHSMLFDHTFKVLTIKCNDNFAKPQWMHNFNLQIEWLFSTLIERVVGPTWSHAQK